MSENTDEDKQHEPTQKKLDDARKKGEVPRSADLTTAAGYGGFLLAATVFGPASLLGLGSILSAPLDRAPEIAISLFGSGPSHGRSTPLAGGLIGEIGAALTPWFLLPAVFALLAVLAQRGLVFAPSRLVPKLSRISPLSGIKQKFGRNGLFEFSKSTVKLLIYGAILGLYLASEMPRILATVALPPAMIVAGLGETCLRLIAIVLAVALAIGAVDLMWQRAEHLRKNRMSHKELRDEFKEAEGDPMLRQARREKGVSIALNQMLGEVPKADVVIVNPTHYAVALRWDRGQGTAPVCVAKGTDAVALRIRTLAMEHGVPVHADPPTARLLFATLEIGEVIPVDHYRAVAAAIRFADAIRAKARKR